MGLTTIVTKKKTNKNNSQQKQAGSKGGMVTSYRKYFQNKYGFEVYDVVKLLLETENPKEVDWYNYTYLSANEISKIKSKLTKGVYNHALYGCNFKIKNPKYVHLKSITDLDWMSILYY